MRSQATCTRDLQFAEPPMCRSSLRRTPTTDRTRTCLPRMRRCSNSALTWKLAQSQQSHFPVHSAESRIALPVQQIAPEDQPMHDVDHLAEQRLKTEKRFKAASSRTGVVVLKPRRSLQVAERDALTAGCFVSLSGKREVGTLHLQGACFWVPGLDYIKYDYAGNLRTATPGTLRQHLQWVREEGPLTRIWKAHSTRSCLHRRLKTAEALLQPWISARYTLLDTDLCQIRASQRCNASPLGLTRVLFRVVFCASPVVSLNHRCRVPRRPSSGKGLSEWQTRTNLTYGVWRQSAIHLQWKDSHAAHTSPSRIKTGFRVDRIGDREVFVCIDDKPADLEESRRDGFGVDLALRGIPHKLEWAQILKAWQQAKITTEFKACRRSRSRTVRPSYALARGFVFHPDNVPQDERHGSLLVETLFTVLLRCI